MTDTPTHPATITLISDFNADTFVRTLMAARPSVEAKTTPFGRPHEALRTVGNNAPAQTDTLIVWTQPHGAVASFAQAQTFAPYDAQQVLDEVDAFAGLIASAARTHRAVFVASWATPRAARGLAPLDFKPHTGLHHLLATMNLRLAQCLADIPNTFILDTERWLSAAGGDAAWSPKMWAAAKVPYAAKVFHHAATDVYAAMDALAGRSRKLIILDLDDTLWGGVVGETGWGGIALGGHSLKGEAFLAFQHRLKALTRRGIVLAIASKNDEAVALDALTHHPDMVLRPGDFAGWRINWTDKATNIAELLRELKLGADAAIFIDDNPAERARVAQALPGILVPDWPTDPTLAAGTLDALPCFDTVAVTDEDRVRSELYAAERQRTAAATPGMSQDEWLDQLGVHIEATPLNAANITRAAQLFNKTNQMNMATRRMTADDLLAWSARAGHHMLTVRVSDKFGDYGLTGIVGIACEGSKATITDFLLSCRVMGRGVEQAMVHLAARWAASAGAETLTAHLTPTERNRPCQEFWAASGFDRDAPDVFSWSLSTLYPAPASITLDTQVAA